MSQTTDPPTSARPANTAETPSERARALVVGAFDLHVHIGPDVPPRRIDDVSLAHRCAELGLAGFALKSHYTSTAERAQVVSGVVPGVRVLGALTLNRAVGGMNALAVEIAAREGARIVWMPTVDSPAETPEIASQCSRPSISSGSASRRPSAVGSRAISMRGETCSLGVQSSVSCIPSARSGITPVMFWAARFHVVIRPAGSSSRMA